MAETIHIDIDAQGNVQVEGVDIIGPDCKKLTAEIESALGTVTKETKKAAYHQKPLVTRKVGA